MITLLKQYVKTFNELFERAGLNRTAKQLELFSDQQLKDIGVSREKLQYGAAAYPWKAQASNVVKVGFNKLTVADADKDKQAA